MQEPKFKIGEKVILLESFHRPDLVGQVFTIGCRIWLLKQQWSDRFSNVGSCWAYHYLSNEREAMNTGYFFPEKNLRPLPPQEKGSWEDCVWKPERENAGA